jgi:hypothetical protein
MWLANFRLYLRYELGIWLQDAGGSAVMGGREVMSGSEFESSDAVFKSRANKLASLLASGEENTRLWRPEELAAIFRHQMAAPIIVDIGNFDSPTAKRLKEEGEARGLLLKSFADLFQHPAPPIELLTLIKDFAKANRDHPASALPPEIASALYYVSIGAALVRLDRLISQLPDDALRQGFQMTLQQDWLDQSTRDLLAKALSKLSERGVQP